MQINGRIVGPIIAFREYIFRDVLPAFGNIDARAGHQQVGHMPTYEEYFFEFLPPMNVTPLHTIFFWTRHSS
jgi:hypothetical protein